MAIRLYSPNPTYKEANYHSSPPYFYYLLICLSSLFITGFLGIFFLWPLAQMTFTSFTFHGNFSLAVIQDIFTDSTTWQVVFITLKLALIATILSLIFGFPGAFLLYRCRFPGRSLLRALVAIPFVMPTLGVGIGFVSLLTKDGLLGFLNFPYGQIPVLMAMIFFNMSLSIRSIGNTWSHLDFRMEEAARSLGASSIRVFLTITLPRLRSVLLGTGSIIFLYCSTAYSLIMVLGGPGLNTIETAIYRETVQYFNLSHAAVLSLLQIALVILALTFSNRFEKQAIASEPRMFSRSLTYHDWPLITLTAILSIFFTVLPMLAVFIRSFRRNGKWTLVNYTDIFRPEASRLLSESLINALLNSIFIALIASLIAMLVAVGALMLRRYPTHGAFRYVQKTIKILLVMPLGVSSVTIGLACF